MKGGYTHSILTHSHNAGTHAHRQTERSIERERNRLEGVRSWVRSVTIESAMHIDCI
jgi:hypothetical protein